MYRVATLGCPGKPCGCRPRPKVVRRARRASFYTARALGLPFDWGALVTGITQGVVGGLTNKGRQPGTINTTPTVGYDPKALDQLYQNQLALQQQQQLAQPQSTPDWLKYTAYIGAAAGVAGVVLALTK